MACDVQHRAHATLRQGQGRFPERPGRCHGDRDRQAHQEGGLQRQSDQHRHLFLQKHALAHMYTNLLNEQIDSNNAIEALYGKIDINLEDGSYKLISEDEKDK